MNYILDHDVYMQTRILDTLEKHASGSRKKSPTGGTSGKRKNIKRINRKRQRAAAQKTRSTSTPRGSYTPPGSSARYDAEFVTNRPNVPQASVGDPKYPSMARRPMNKPPRGAVDVDEAIRRGARRVREGASRAIRVPGNLARGAVDSAIDVGGQLYYGSIGEGLRESAVKNARRSAERKSARQRATQPYDPRRAKAIRRLNAMRARRAIGGARRRLGRSVGNLGSALGQRISAATQDARMGTQMMGQDITKGLRSLRQGAGNLNRRLSQSASDLGGRLGSRISAATQDARIGAQLAADNLSERLFPSSTLNPKPPSPKRAPKQQTPPTPTTPKKKPSSTVSSSRKSPTLSISSPLAKPPAGVDVVDDVAKGAKQAKGARPYGKYGLGGLMALGGGYAIHKGIQNIRKLMDSNNKMKKVSSAAMNNGMPKNAVQHLLKTASAKLIEQEQELAQLRQWYQEAQVLTKAASVADRLVATGQLDYSDRDDKAVELASDPDRLPIVEEAINMMHNPSAFSVASISDEYSDARTARTQLESYLLGH